MQEDGVRAYGLEGHYAGTESTGLGVLELETKPQGEVLDRVGEAAKRLVERGADCILLGKYHVLGLACRPIVTMPSLPSSETDSIRLCGHDEFCGEMRASRCIRWGQRGRKCY